MRRTILLATSLLLAASAFAGPGKMLIINADAPGIGFNDPTPAEPVGGNPGTTRGAQRYNVYLKAAEKWTTYLDMSVDVRVRGSFAPLDCSGNSAVLGQTFINSWISNFANAPRPDVYYPSALANQFAATDLGSGDDMFIQFNSSIDEPGCLGDRSWYYGYDGNEGDNDSLYHVVLHEIAHGLGMASRSSTDFGILNQPSVYDLYTLDLVAGLTYDQMTKAQRDVSIKNTSSVVWIGDAVTRMAPSYLQPLPVFTVTQPAPVARHYDIGTASFGPAVSTASMSGRVVQATDAGDAAGPATTDGCSALSNGGEINGNIALIDRGSCDFIVKVRYAQSAGAIGVIIADNRRDTCLPPGIGASGDTTDITIPVISVTQDQGLAFGAQLSQSAEIRGMLHVDPSRMAGASDQGYVRLYTPCTINPGSSKHHWDVVASPNLLMEPFINGDLTDGIDLSMYQLLDIGWTLNRTGRRFVPRK
ncbi:MAG TPA: PA domain-containing protein [Thermoanaerobaculia bacterium]